jgi:hypothetical protein
MNAYATMSPRASFPIPSAKTIIGGVIGAILVLIVRGGISERFIGLCMGIVLSLCIFISLVCRLGPILPSPSSLPPFLHACHAPLEFVWQPKNGCIAAQLPSIVTDDYIVSPTRLATNGVTSRHATDLEGEAIVPNTSIDLINKLMASLWPALHSAFKNNSSMFISTINEQLKTLDLPIYISTPRLIELGFPSDPPKITVFDISQNTSSSFPTSSLAFSFHLSFSGSELGAIETSLNCPSPFAPAEVIASLPVAFRLNSLKVSLAFRCETESTTNSSLFSLTLLQSPESSIQLDLGSRIGNRLVIVDNGHLISILSAALNTALKAAVGKVGFIHVQWLPFVIHFFCRDQKSTQELLN